MTFRKIVKGAILATALALSSCHASVKTPKIRAKKPLVEKAPSKIWHPCEKEVVPGGMKTHSYILFQIHGDAVSLEGRLNDIEGGITRDQTGTMTDEAVLSQILQFRVISGLTKRYGVKTVILEGMPKQSLKLVPKERMGFFERDFFEKLVSISEKCIPDAMKTYPEIPGKQVAEDFCLALYIFKSRVSHRALLIRNNPTVVFRGFERKDFHKRIERAFSADEIIRRFERAKKRTDIMKRAGQDPNISEELSKEERNDDQLRFLFEGRSKDAIHEAISYSSQNTVLVIGAGHKDSMKDEISRIPKKDRPTFHLIPPSCQSSEEFRVSLEAIQLARDNVGRM